MKKTWLFDSVSNRWETERGHVRLVVIPSGDDHGSGWYLVRLVLSPSTVLSWDINGSLEQVFQFADDCYAHEFHIA